MPDSAEHGLAGGVRGLPPTVRWVGGDQDGWLELLDQTLLPATVAVRRCTTAHDVWTAIRELSVRGAPAIGVAAGFGLCLAARDAIALPHPDFRERVRQAAHYLGSSRPTAVNLAWALKRVASAADRVGADSPAACRAMLAEAHAIAREDAEACRRIGEVGATLIRSGMGILTHCNAGALATVAYGTALAPMYVAHERGVAFRVYANETRPLLQGARLTALELSAAGIDVTVLCDGAAGWLLASGRVQLVLVGADRIAANGDTANKIGTYGVALAAARHNIPFYVAAPESTFDLTVCSGADIPIEERSAEELRAAAGTGRFATDAACWNPAFDVTPAELIRGFVTPKGLLEPVSEQNITVFFGDRGCKAGQSC